MGEPLHEVPIIAVNCLQMHNIFLRYLESMEILIGRSSTLEVCWNKVICLHLLEMSKESNNLTHGSRTVVKLLPISNLVLGASSVGDGLRRNFKHCISFQ